MNYGKAVEIETFVPHSLPLKELDWGRLMPYVGDAREKLARFDCETIGREQFEKRKWEEATASLRGQASESKIANAKKGLDLAIRLAKRESLNMAFLCKVHAVVKADGPNKKEIGHLRKKQNWIGPKGCKIEDAYFYPPQLSEMKKSLRNLQSYMRRKEKDPLVKLAIFVAQFLIIHPFMDGNGRLVRIFIPVWLWKEGLTRTPAFFMSAYFEYNRAQYFRRLYNISKEGAWEDWIEFFLKGIV